MFRSWDHIFHDQNLPSGYDIASSPWNITMLLIGKPSISMGHGFHSYVSHNQMVTNNNPTNIKYS